MNTKLSREQKVTLAYLLRSLPLHQVDFNVLQALRAFCKALPNAKVVNMAFSEIDLTIKLEDLPWSSIAPVVLKMIISCYIDDEGRSVETRIVKYRKRYKAIPSPLASIREDRLSRYDGAVIMKRI